MRNSYETPLYTVGDVAHYLDIPRSTVQAWGFGQDNFKPVLIVSDRAHHLLSFRNLVEIFNLSSLRGRHNVPLPKIRKAIQYAREQFGVEHFLFSKDFYTNGKDVFIDHLGKLISASEHGQLAMKDVLDQYLKRLEFKDGIPARLFPLTTHRPDDMRRIVLIDPEIRFGQPCIRGTRIPTAIVAERYKAGDSIPSLARDYGRKTSEIEEAIRYEFTGRAA